MRTTITLEPDVAALLERDMKQRAISFKQAVNDAVRRGLTPKATVDFSFHTYDLGGASFDIDKARHLAAELEDEAVMRKLAEGR